MVAAVKFPCPPLSWKSSAEQNACRICPWAWLKCSHLALGRSKSSFLLSILVQATSWSSLAIASCERLLRRVDAIPARRESIKNTNSLVPIDQSAVVPIDTQSQIELGPHGFMSATLLRARGLEHFLWRDRGFCTIHREIALDGGVLGVSRQKFH